MQQVADFTALWGFGYTQGLSTLLAYLFVANNGFTAKNCIRLFDDSVGGTDVDSVFDDCQLGWLDFVS